MLEFIHLSLTTFAKNTFESELINYNSQNIQESVSYRRTMKYAPEFNVIYSLVIEDPSEQNANWNIEAAMNGKTVI